MNKEVWKLSDEKYEFIKGEVVHIFEMYEIRCIPVSGFEIAIKMGITLIPYSSFSRRKLKAARTISEDGFFCENGGKEMIFYNDMDYKYDRQNFTILHEIGHIVLDHTGRGEHEEDEANFFAKYAIAPPILVDKINPRSWLDIYDRFDISETAAAYAYRYYLKWKGHHKLQKTYTDYENRLLQYYDRYGGGDAYERVI